MKATKIKKKNILLGTVCTTIAMTTVLFIWSGTQVVSASEYVRINTNKMKEVIRIETENRSLLSFSSNPYDYAKDNVYFDRIVDQGVAALPELENMLQSSEANGLSEYLIAIAIEEITRASVNDILNNVDYGWATAEEFFEEWSVIKNDVEQKINDVIGSPILDQSEKIETISHYGILAIPVIDSYISNSNPRARMGVNNDMLESLQSLKESYNLTSNDIKMLNEYINH